MVLLENLVYSECIGGRTEPAAVAPVKPTRLLYHGGVCVVLRESVPFRESDPMKRHYFAWLVIGGGIGDSSWKRLLGAGVKRQPGAVKIVCATYSPPCPVVFFWQAFA